MFGQQPGNERRIGVMNQSVITRLDGHKVTYYVLHTRGENPTSILITALTEAANAKRMPKDEADKFVFQRITGITAQQLYVSARDYDRVKDVEITMWNQTKKATLEAVTNAATGSCVLGIVSEVDDEQST